MNDVVCDQIGIGESGTIVKGTADMRHLFYRTTIEITTVRITTVIITITRIVELKHLEL